MITDALLKLESSRTDVRAAATYVSGNTIDLLSNRDIGVAGHHKVVWNIEVAYAGGTSIQFEQIISASADLSSPVVIDAGIVVPLANLLIGGMIARPIPELLAGTASFSAPKAGVAGIGSKGLRYYGAQEISLGTMTAGTHSCHVVMDTIDVKHYPGGYTIL